MLKMGWTELRPLANVKATHKARMANNEFNVMFKEVEIDSSFDLNKFMDAEIEFDHIYKKLGLANHPQINGRFNLRIRKIRGQRAGTFYQTHRTIVLHPDYIDSFIHELGHLLDYNLAEGVQKTYQHTGKTLTKRPLLSSLDAFKPIVEAYTEHFKASGGKGTHNGKYNVKYYLTETEIFARTFELYILKTFGETVLTETEDEYIGPTRGKAIYPLFNKDLMALIMGYYNNLFNYNV